VPINGQLGPGDGAIQVANNQRGNPRGILDEQETGSPDGDKGHQEAERLPEGLEEQSQLGREVRHRNGGQLVDPATGMLGKCLQRSRLQVANHVHVVVLLQEALGMILHPRTASNVAQHDDAGIALLGWRFRHRWAGKIRGLSSIYDNCAFCLWFG